MAKETGDPLLDSENRELSLDKQSIQDFAVDLKRSADFLISRSDRDLSLQRYNFFGENGFVFIAERQNNDPDSLKYTLLKDGETQLILKREVKIAESHIKSQNRIHLLNLNGKIYSLEFFTEDQHDLDEIDDQLQNLMNYTWKHLDEGAESPGPQNVAAYSSFENQSIWDRNPSSDLLGPDLRINSADESDENNQPKIDDDLDNELRALLPDEWIAKEGRDNQENTTETVNLVALAEEGEVQEKFSINVEKKQIKSVIDNLKVFSNNVILRNNIEISKEETEVFRTGEMSLSVQLQWESSKKMYLIKKNRATVVQLTEAVISDSAEYLRESSVLSALVDSQDGSRDLFLLFSPTIELFMEVNNFVNSMGDLSLPRRDESTVSKTILPEENSQELPEELDATLKRIWEKIKKLLRGGLK